MKGIDWDESNMCCYRVNLNLINQHKYRERQIYRRGRFMPESGAAPKCPSRPIRGITRFYEYSSLIRKPLYL